MNTMLRWSPTRQFHYDVDDLSERFFGGATDGAAQRPWLPAAEARTEDGTYVIQLALPGVDSKDVQVSLMDNVLTVKRERKADHDTAAAHAVQLRVDGPCAHPSVPRARHPASTRRLSRSLLPRCAPAHAGETHLVFSELRKLYGSRGPSIPVSRVILMPHARSGVRWSSRRSLGSSFGCPRPPFEPLARFAVPHSGLVLGQPLPLPTVPRQTAV